MRQLPGIVDSVSSRTKAERMVIALKEEDAGVGLPGGPTLTMQIMDFDPDSALMLSKHFP